MCWGIAFHVHLPGGVAQSVGHPTRKSGVLDTRSGNILSFLLLLFSRRAVVSYWRKYVHEVLVNSLGGLSLPRKSVVRLTDCPDMTIDVYRGRKTTIQPTTKSMSIHPSSFHAAMSTLIMPVFYVLIVFKLYM